MFLVKYSWFDVFSLLVKLDGLFYGVGVGILFKVMRGRMKSEEQTGPIPHQLSFMPT
jgi:hypothetical protein